MTFVRAACSSKGRAFHNPKTRETKGNSVMAGLTDAEEREHARKITAFPPSGPALAPRGGTLPPAGGAVRPWTGRVLRTNGLSVLRNGALRRSNGTFLLSEG